MQMELFASLFHLDKEAGFPDQIGKACGLALLDTIFESGSGLLIALMSEGLKQAVAENLRLAFLVTVERSRVIYESGYGFDDLRHASSPDTF
jgi:hypothetical protein